MRKMNRLATTHMFMAAVLGTGIVFGSKPRCLAGVAARTIMISEQAIGRFYDTRQEETYSDGGYHFAYVTHEGDKSLVVLDGTPGPEYYLVTRLSLSPDGLHTAYYAKKEEDGNWLTVIDGTEKHFDYDGVTGLVFSPDSKRYIHWMRKDGRCFVVTDGQPGFPFDGIADPVFSPDGKHVAYTGIYGGLTTGRWVPVVDEHIITEPDANQISHLTFSPTGGRLAYSGQKGNRNFVVVDGVKGPDYEWVGPPRFSPDGKHVAYPAKRDGKCFMVIDGKPESRTYFDVGRIGFGVGGVELADAGCFFSRDGSRVAYCAKTTVQRWRVVIDEKEEPEYDDIALFTFSPDGKRFAYCAEKDRRWSVVVDGQSGPSYDHVGKAWFSQDSLHVAYRGRDSGREVVVLDGQPGPKFAYVHLGGGAFSPDGKHFAYAAQREMESTEFVVLNTQGCLVYLVYDWIANYPLTFRDTGVLEFLAARNHTLYRLKVTPK